MNHDISRLVAGLLEQAKAGADSSAEVDRVRRDIKKLIEGGDTILGKILALVESFGGVLPDENQRYQAAVTALSATSKLSRQEIVASLNRQVEELSVLEKHLVSALPAGAAARTAREARQQEIRNETARLRERLAQLEKEEKGLAGGSAGRSAEGAAVEQAMRQVFAGIGAEISDIIRKIEGSRGESMVSKSAPIIEFEAEESGTKHKSAERASGVVAGTGEKGRAGAESIFPEPVQPGIRKKPEKDRLKPDPVQGQASELKQKCSMCGGQMDYYAAEGKWQCYACGFEYIKNEPGKQEPQASVPEKGGRPNALFVVSPSEPLFERSGKTKPSPGYWGAKKQPSPNRLPLLSKTCPSCGQKMHSPGSGKGWKCSFCGYERRI